MGTPKAKQDRKVDKDYVGADDPIIGCTARGGFPHQRHRFSAPLIAWFTSCDVSLYYGKDYLHALSALYCISKTFWYYGL